MDLRRALLAACVASLCAPAVAAGESTRTIIIERAPGLNAGERAALRRDAGTTLVRSLPLPRTEVVRARPGRLDEALRALARDPDVAYAEPDRQVRAVTNDTHFPLLWGLENAGDADIDAPEAWAVTRGAGQTVAVVDSGVALVHPDLVDRIAANPGESGDGREANGLDDDGNGLVDDWRGWDWVEDDSTPEDADGHGTHVAGTIAATADNAEGVAGVAPEAAVMPLRVLDATGSGSTSDLVAAFEWAGRAGIPVVNASLGADSYSQAERDVIARHPGTLFVVAAGNDGVDVDVTPQYPCALDLANVLCVGASTDQETRAGFSNYGAEGVDLFAPGEWIASTAIAPDDYVYMDGTSMASPHVAGAAALVHAAVPSADTAALKAALLGSSDPHPAYAGRSVTGGRLNAATAIDVARGTVAPRAYTTTTPAPPPTATPTPSPSPTPAPSTPPVASEPAPVPVVPPAPSAPPPLSDATASPAAAALYRLRLSSRRLGRRGIRVRYRLSAPASVRVRLVRSRCRRRCTLRRPTVQGRTGTNAFRLRRGRLRPGRYRLRVQAVDGTRRSSRRSASLTITR